MTLSAELSFYWEKSDFNDIMDYMVAEGTGFRNQSFYSALATGKLYNHCSSSHEGAQINQRRSFTTENYCLMNFVSPTGGLCTERYNFSVTGDTILQ
jgi:hypothetical protein